jgi:hypothetical protein
MDSRAFRSRSSSRSELGSSATGTPESVGGWLRECSESTPEASSDDGRELFRRGASVRVIADASVALVDHTQAERPGLDQLQRDVFGDRWKERRAATDNVGVAEHAQLVDKAKLDRSGGQAGAADPYILVCRVESLCGLLGAGRCPGRCLGCG